MERTVTHCEDKLKKASLSQKGPLNYFRDFMMQKLLIWVNCTKHVAACSCWRRCSSYDYVACAVSSCAVHSVCPYGFRSVRSPICRPSRSRNVHLILCRRKISRVGRWVLFVWTCASVFSVFPKHGRPLTQHITRCHVFFLTRQHRFNTAEIFSATKSANMDYVAVCASVLSVFDHKSPLTQHFTHCRTL